VARDVGAARHGRGTRRTAILLFIFPSIRVGCGCRSGASQRRGMRDAKGDVGMGPCTSSVRQRVAAGQRGWLHRGLRASNFEFGLLACAPASGGSLVTCLTAADVLTWWCSARLHAVSLCWWISSRARPSPSRWSRPTLSIWSSPKSRTRKASRPISSASSLQVFQHFMYTIHAL